jgi:hypothetical protein
MEKSITFSVTDDDYNQLKSLAKKQGMTLAEFVKFFLLLLTNNNSLLAPLKSADVKKNLEDSLQNVSDLLEKQQRFLDLALRSIYSTQLTLEGQFKKYRKEAAKELEKDFERISLMVNVAKSKKTQKS